jgi:hypothetical protein
VAGGVVEVSGDGALGAKAEGYSHTNPQRAQSLLSLVLFLYDSKHQ